MAPSAPSKSKSPFARLKSRFSGSSSSRVGEPNPATTPTSNEPLSRPTPQDAVKSTWEKALSSIPPKHRDSLGLSEHDIKSLDRLKVVNAALEATRRKHELCVRNQWRVTIKGKEVALRDITDGIIRRLDKFKAIGHSIVQYDPAHFALPWAGVLFLLQVSIEDSNTLELLLIALERLADLIDRCAIYEELYLKPSIKESRLRTKAVENFERALVRLYAEVLLFIVEAKRYLSRGTAIRSLQGAVTADALSLKDVEREERSVHMEVAVVEAEYQRDAHEQINSNISANLKELLVSLDQPIHTIDLGVRTVNAKVTAMRDAVEESKRTEILLWLSQIPYEKLHAAAREGRVENTGQWLLDNTLFRDWYHSAESQSLWLHGIPGAGKTKLASRVIDHLSGNLSTSSALCYFYCGRGESLRRDPSNILGAFIKQLSTALGSCLPDAVVADYKKRKRDGFSSGVPTLDERLAMLTELLETIPETFIVLDALDECEQTERAKLMKALQFLISGTEKTVKIFITSRDEHDIVRKLDKTPNHYISASDNAEDIERFVRTEIERCIDDCELLDGEVDQELQKRICETLLQKANGMFLWVHLQIKGLCELDIRSDVEERLGKLPTTLSDTYRDIYSSISAQKGSTPQIALSTLKWMVCCRRPMSPSEVVTALCIGLSKELTDITVAVILKACRNLLVLDRQRNVLELAHLSVNEYFEKTECSRPASNLLAAKVCLKFYIRLVGSRPPLTPRAAATVVTGYDHLLQYATLFWTSHTIDCAEADDDETMDLLAQFLGTFSEPGAGFLEWFTKCSHFMNELTLREQVKRVDDKLARNFPRFDCAPLVPLPLAAVLGLGKRVEPLWTAHFNGNFRNKHDEPLLYLSIVGNNLWIVEHILNKGAEVNARGGYNEYALIAALLNRSITRTNESLEICRLLLSRGADPNSRGGDWGTALQIAVLSFDLEVMEEILTRGANIDEVYGWYGTALQTAVEATEDMRRVKYLLEKGADPNQIGGRLGTPLQAALASGRTDIAQVLVDAGARLDLTGGKFGSVLEPAVSSCHDLEFIKFLIKSGVDVNTHNGCGEATPLQNAARFESRQEFLDLLLENGADVNASFGFFGTALQAAVLNANLTTIDKLLSRKAELNTRCGFFGSALQAVAWASWLYSRETTRRLVAVWKENGADVNYTGGEYGTALQAAAAGGHRDLVENLLENGADVNRFDSDATGAYGSALQAAISTGHDDLAEVLRACGAQLNPNFNLDSEPSPSHWSLDTCSKRLMLSKDLRTVTYSTEDFWGASVLANHPVPLRNDVFYFEIDILPDTRKAPPQGAIKIGVGLCNRGTDLDFRPGLGSHSYGWGYFSESGRIFSTRFRENLKLQGPPYTFGDTIGVGVIPKRRTAFFTKNGRLLGMPCRHLTGRLFPVVGMANEAKINVNFGDEEGRGFKYAISEQDLEAGETGEFVEYAHLTPGLSS